MTARPVSPVFRWPRCPTRTWRKTMSSSKCTRHRFTPDELDWPGTWTDRAGRDRTPTIPGHEVSGVVVELGFGTTGLAVGERVIGLTDWARNGTLAEYVAVEARNLAPLSAGIDHVTAAALADAGIDRLAGVVRPRTSVQRPDHPHSRCRRRCRFDGRATGAGDGSQGDRQRSHGAEGDDPGPRRR